MEGLKVAETEGWKVADTIFCLRSRKLLTLFLRVGKLPTIPIETKGCMPELKYKLFLKLKPPLS